MNRDISAGSAMLRRLRFGLERYVFDVPRKPTSRWHAAKERWLLISLPDSISQSQIFPFHFYRSDFKEIAGVEICEISLDEFERSAEDFLCSPTAVFFQFWIDKTQLQARELAKKIRRKWLNAKCIFLDPFAPADLRYAEALDSEIDFYFKKHVLRNRGVYGQQTLGDTNLSHWYGEKFGLSQTEVCHVIPIGFLDKLKICPSFFLAPYLISYFSRAAPRDNNFRKYDLHARLGGAGPVGWYPVMRQHSLDRVRELVNYKVTPQGMVGRRSYLREIGNSMACFSPFGYGEVCWRDYEAVALGAVLIKPHMDHLETVPNIFVPWETYVPIDWDFGGLEMALARVKTNASLRRKLTRQSFEILSAYVREKKFVNFVLSSIQLNA